MIDMKALHAKCVACVADMDATYKRLEEVRGDKTMSDEDKATRLTELEGVYKDLKAKTEAIQLEMVRAEEIQRVREMAAKIGAETEIKPTEVQPTDGEGSVSKIDAQAKDTKKSEAQKSRMFCEWLSGKTMPEKFTTEMQPTSQKLLDKSASPEMAIVLPEALRRKVVGSYWGKTDGILLSTGAGGHGEANLFDDEFRANLLELPPEPGIVYPRTTKVPTVTGSVKWPRLVQTDADEYGTVAVDWTGEGVEKPKTEPQFDQLVINTNELAAQTQVSRTLMGRSAIDLERFIPRIFRDAVVDELDNVVLTGDGVSKPLGVTQDATVRKIFRKTLNDIDYEDIVAMKYAIRSHHRAAMMFVIADDAVEVLVKKLDGEGRPFFVPNPQAGQFDRLLGIPVMTTHRTTAFADGDIILADWSQYISPVEQEILIQRSEHRHMEKGLILFVLTLLVGGRVSLGRAFAVLQAAIS